MYLLSSKDEIEMEPPDMAILSNPTGEAASLRRDTKGDSVSVLLILLALLISPLSGLSFDLDTFSAAILLNTLDIPFTIDAPLWTNSQKINF
jgi:hypothetical protein